MKALFLAKSFSEASYWARVWGYGPNEWIFGLPYNVHGLRPNGITVYVCGSGPIEVELVDYLEARGFEEFIDAHDISHDREPLSALSNLPLK